MSNTVDDKKVFRQALLWGVIITLAIAVIGSAIGWFIAGEQGLYSVLVGAGITLFFSSITVISILVASYFDSAAFLAIVMGSWILKMAGFIGLLVMVKGQPFIDPMILFITLALAILANVAVDVFVVVRSKLPYVSNLKLPK